MQRLVLLIADELLHGTVGILDALVHLVGIDLRTERVVQEVDGAVDVTLGVLQQVGDLSGHQSSDRHDEHDHRHDQREKDHQSGATSSPTASFEPGDSGFDGE